MKKIKFLGAAILAASLIFAGCANGSDDDVDSTPDTEKVVDEKGGEGSEENGGSESGSGEEAGSGEENSGEDQNSGSGESSGSGDSGSSSGGDTGAGDTDGGDTDDGDTEAEDGDDEDTDDPITEEDLMNPDLSYSTLTVYGAEENDVNLGGTQNWWNGPAFSEENNEIVVNFGNAGGSGAYTISFNVVEDDIIAVEYKAEVPAQLRFVTENSNGQKKECNVNTVASEDYTKALYKFEEAGKLIQIGFIAAGETGKLNVKSIALKTVDTSDSLSAIISSVEAYLDTVTVGSAVGNFPQDAVDALEAAIATATTAVTANSNRKEWFAAENALTAALETFKAAQVKPTFPTTGHDVDGATYIYTSTNESDSKIGNLNPDWGQASSQAYESVTVGDTTRKIIVLDLKNYQGMDLNDVDITTATKICFEYNTTDTFERIDIYPIYTKKTADPKEYPIAWTPIADGEWHTAEITLDKTNPATADAIDQIKFVSINNVEGKIYYDNLRVE